jgi:hypothetical protein
MTELASSAQHPFSFFTQVLLQLLSQGGKQDWNVPPLHASQSVRVVGTNWQPFLASKLQSRLQVP